MCPFRLTLHFSSGEVQTAELEEGQYSVGSGEADQLRIPTEGVAEGHLRFTLTQGRMQVEPTFTGVSINGHGVDGPMEVELPASIEMPGAALVIEAMAGAEIPFHEQATIVPEGLGRQPAGKDAPPGQSDDMAPLQGAYKLVKEIARGGMGQIYFGEDPQLKRHVTIKVSSLAEHGMDPRLAKEAEVLAQLAHPSIVPVYNIGMDGQRRPYYSMKLVKGRTLQAVLNDLKKGDAATQREYPLPALLTIFRKVCDAMAFAHSKGFLHRDLKPENIMVGEYGEVLVMDWGLAKQIGTAQERTGSTCTGTHGDMGMTIEGEVIGTPLYMSPEQAEGMVSGLDERSDIYSLGGILYALLTLRAPIEGSTLNEVLTKVKGGQISAMITQHKGTKVEVGTPIAMERKVPEALQAVTLKAMARERDKRYASVEAFAADIEAYQNGFATQAEEAGAFKRLRLWVGRNKVLTGSAAAMLTVVSGFSVKVVAEGRKATLALDRLSASAPTFAQRAEDALKDGNLEEALEAASNAVDLQSDVTEYHRILGNVLQVMGRWPAAVKEYQLAKGDDEAERNLKLTEELIGVLNKQGEMKAKTRLFEELNKQGRQYEAMTLSKALGDFWNDRKKDLSAIPELVKRLEAKLLPIPGTKTLMSKTEFTVGEWKLYLRAEGYPEWQQPEPNTFIQTDEHPVVKIS
jgi:serine/threonine protein kinase